MKAKQFVEISKCLSNQTRLDILEWLKDPEGNFPPNTSSMPNTEGVCVTFIHEKTGLSQSTISTYLTSMLRCELLEMKRVGKWTYFKRNEKVIKAYCDYLL
ncbi:ArsR/SmtB family transcription factor [Neptunitalea lumnitzerae]|uniref:Transcriptional regulator n=1 Tax=Neptunitalea lumnitzerae TaxID=2965509 RepID=A0ABQ5MKD5_9FLAO|nr:helix-turn-helix transcriptional regulator [Neptunitalea sp. Y10]GLB49392.1 transcriptional regulator [Neptunitalea sp. Y10]